MVDFDLLPVVSKPDDKRNPDELHAGEKFGVSFLVFILTINLLLFSTYPNDFFKWLNIDNSFSTAVKFSLDNFL